MNLNNKDKNDKAEFDISEFAGFFLILAIASPIVGIFTVKILKFDMSAMGAYGDFWGGSIVPFLTFATVLYVIKSNRLIQEQIDNQNKEGRFSRFENTFFHLMSDLKNSPSNDSSYTDLKKYMYHKVIASDDELNLYMKKSKNSLGSKAWENEFYENYGGVLFDAYIRFVYSKRMVSENTLSKGENVYLVLKLIYLNREILDQNELDFHMRYLFKLVGRHLYVIVLYDLFLSGKSSLEILHYTKALEYISAYDTFSTTDYDLFQRMLVEDIDIFRQPN